MKVLKCLFTVIISLNFIFYGQFLNAQELDLKSLRIAELTKLAYENRNDALTVNIFKELNEEILSLNQHFSVYLFPSFINEVLDLDTDYHETFFGFEGLYPELGEVNFDPISFNIFISNDSIYVNDQHVNILELSKLLIDFKTYVSNEFPDRILSNYESKYFGNTAASVIYTAINVNIDSNKGMTSNEWQLFFNCLHEIITAYEEEQNNLSLQKWNKQFTHLTNEQKEDILQVIPYCIYVYLEFIKK